MDREACPSGTRPSPCLQWAFRRLIIESLDTRFWSYLYSIEVSSDECLAKVQALVSNRSSIIVIRSFKGNEAETFINFLDQVSKLCVQCFDDLKALIVGSCAVAP